MASIQKIVSPLTGDTSYRAQIRVRGKSESATFPKKSEAVEWAASIETAIREGKHFPHAAARRKTFEGLAADYLTTVVPEMLESQRATRTQQVMWWAKRFEGLTVAELSSAESTAVSDARAKLAAEMFMRGKAHKDKKSGEMIQPKKYKRSPATVNRYVAALSAVMTFAIKDRKLITSNPVSALTRKAEPRGRTRFLTDAERVALLDACEASGWPALKALVLLAITSGARRGEMTCLKWSDLDMAKGRATVRETKNDEQRTLVIRGEALKALRTLETAREALPQESRGEFVFPNPSGHPGHFEFFDAYWNKAVDAAGLENFRFHDLRHTCASYLAAEKCSLLEIADVLGHKTLAMVKRYSHLLDDHKAGVIERVMANKGL